MTPEAKNLPPSIRDYGEVERYEKEPKEVFEPEQPLRYDRILQRAIIEPIHFGHRTIRDRRGRSTEVIHAKGRLIKPRLPTSNPVTALTDMRDPDVKDTETVRLSAPFADWFGGIGVNINLRDRRVSAGLKRKVINRRRSGLKIIG